MNIPYQEKNVCPNKSLELRRGSIYSVINAAAITTELDWRTVVHRLLDTAHKCALMPTDKTIVPNLFQSLGLCSVHIRNRKDGLERFIAYRQTQSPCERYIVQVEGCGIAALIPSPEDPSNYILQGLMKAKSVSPLSIILKCWVYSPQLANQTDFTRDGHKSKRVYENHAGFKAVNLNPKDNSVGDCAVRALAGAYDCDWHEAVELLAQTSDYTDPVINGNEILEQTLTRLGFVRHKAIRSNNRLLDGRAFCNMITHSYCKAERIFAYVGKSHVIAVLPFEEDGRIKYKVQDSWDSTSRKIQDYWVLDPREKERALKKAENTPSVDLSTGQHITHPKFGEGVLLSLSDSYAEIDFGQTGIKKISVAWLVKEIDKSQKAV